MHIVRYWTSDFETLAAAELPIASALVSDCETPFNAAAPAACAASAMI